MVRSFLKGGRLCLVPIDFFACCVISARRSSPRRSLLSASGPTQPIYPQNLLQPPPSVVLLHFQQSSSISFLSIERSVRCGLRTIIAITVAAIVALHSALGCCWHHGQDSPSTVERGDRGSMPPTRSSRCGCHGFVPPTSTEATLREQSQTPKHESCFDRCEFLAKVRTEREDVRAYCLNELASTLKQPIVLPVVFPSQAKRIWDLIDPSPVRRHLLLRVLLI